MIDYLTDALLLEILVRIHDAKFAHQCKSVTKRWRTLISTPWFVRSFVRHKITVINKGTPSPPPLQLPFTYIHEYPGPKHKKDQFHLRYFPNMFGPTGFSLSFLPFYDSDISGRFFVRIVASSNDLLLCHSGFSPAVYYICNPFTKQWAEIPLCSHINVTHKYDYSVIGFVCDSHYKVVFDNKNVGFRVVDTLYRYKIVRLSCLISSPKSYSLEIYSSDTGEWTQLDLHVSCPWFLQVVDTHPCSSGVVSDGRLHWTCGTNYIFAHDLFNNKNKNNNIIEVIDLPVEFRGAGKVQTMGVCGGRLRLLKICRESMFVVWELEDYRSVKWRKVQEASFLCTDPIWNRSTVSFHPYDGNIVYFWISSVVFSCNNGIFSDVGTMFFLLLQPWFPTPVSSPLLPY